MVTSETSPLSGGEALLGACNATAVPITVSDPRQADNPMIWVNPAFSEVTGYGAAEAIGRNCRFLQGPDTDAAAVDELRNAVASRRDASVTLLNYRKDGSTFWNQVSVSPVFDADGLLVNFVGMQIDVSERVRAEERREQAYIAERAAREDAERSRAETERGRQRLALVAEATTQLASTLDIDETLQRLGRLLVPAIGDWVSVSLFDDAGRADRIVARHRDGMHDELDRYCGLAVDQVDDAAGSHRVARSGTPILIATATESDWRSLVSSAELVSIVETLGVSSLLYVPLLARDGRIIGLVSLVCGSSGRTFTDDDLSVAVDIGRRASITLGNARLYQRQHRVAETLQRSLLPVLPSVNGLEVAARYKPGDTAAQVGGDFYDLLRFPDGSIGVVVGDVVGHDLSAAAAMGHLRGLLRAAAWDEADGGGDPRCVVDRVNRLVQGLELPLATMLYGVLRTVDDPPGGWEFTYASAGHPEALLVDPDRTITALDQSQGILLGAANIEHPPAATVKVPPRSILVAFTDGLVERRSESIESGYARLSCVLVNHVGGPDALADELLRVAGNDSEDDTAVIVIQNP